MRKLSLALLTLCLLVPSAFGQSNTGTLRGTVVDPQGSGLPGATVVVTDNATGRERTIQASGDGTFSLAQLEVGTYTVRVQVQGFKTFVAQDVKIDIAREYALTATLEAGGVEETVTVVAGADVINSTSAELSNTVSQRQIQELPLNGRNPLSLISLQPGAVSNGATNTVINGQQSSFTNITRDGLNIQDNFIRSNATDFVPDRPNVDDVGEFTVTTQNAGAERGYGASQVELVTPRGTSEFHGSAFIYNRNSKFTANSFFNNSSGVTKPFLNRNQFGGRLGGPLPLFNFGEGGPAFLRDKGFFFVSYEGFRLRQSSSVTRTILTPTARQGIFQYNATCGTSTTPACPAGITNGQLLQLNVLGVAGVTPDPLIASRILANVPTAGNETSIGDRFNTTGLRFSQKANQDRESVTARVDILPSSRQAFEFIYGYRKELLLRPDIEGGGGYNTIPFGFQDAFTDSFVTAWRFSPTATLTNEVRGGFLFSEPAFGRTNEPTDFFLSLPLISSPESVFQTQGRDTQQYTLQDNANWTRGNHNIRFGGQFQAFRVNPFGPPAFSSSTIPTLVIGTNTSTPSLAASQFPGGISTGQLGSANSLLALLGGIISSANLTFNATSPTSGLLPNTLPSRDLHFENYGFYVADSWRATQRLTLNFGLRYELFSPLREPNRLAVEPVIPAGTDPIQAILNPNGQYNLVGTNAGGSNFFSWDKNNFAPVVSFAWSPTFRNNFLNSVFPGEGRTVLRGGYRISYVNDEFVRGADNALNGNQAFTQQVVRSNLNLRTAGGAPAFTAPTLSLPRTYAQNNALAGNFGTVFAIDPNLEVPMTHEWNFGIQREIGFNTALELRYVGGMSNNLIRGLDYNQVDIFGNGFLEDFERARRNLARFNNPACAPTATTGCEVLTVFPQLASGGLLANATIRSLIAGGTPADLAVTYITNQFAGSSQLFLPNPNTGVADLLSNSAKYRYNSLQAEVRRRFSQGFLFQANYTFQKTLTDTGGTGQTNFDPALDINNLDLEYARADYDATHVFNFYTIYELPFGRGKRWFNEGGAVNTILGGWQFTSIVQASSGAPITITDARGTLNRAARSARQTAFTNLSGDQVRDLFGIFNTPCGIYYINPSVLDVNQEALNSGQCGQLLSGGRTGRASRGFGQPTFPGQVFFNVAPGQTGNMQRAIANGPIYVNWDASIIKNIPLDFLREGMRFQIRGEAFNVLNRPNFFFGNTSSINSTSAGRINSTFASRVVQFVGRFEF